MSMFDSLTSRDPNGLTNAAPWQTMGASGIPDPTWSHVYSNDFDTYLASDWTVALAGGSGTQALAAGDGGILALTNSAVITDAIYMQLTHAGFNLKPGKATFYKFAGTLSDLTEVAYWGLVQVGATSLASITDGIFLSKASGSGALTLNSRVGGVATTLALPTQESIVAATAFELGLYVDYLGNLAAFFNPTTGSNPISAAAAASTQARGRVAALYAAGLGVNPGQSAALVLTTANLTPAFGFVNGAASARTMSVDFVVASRER